MTVWLEMRDPNYYRNVSAPTTDSPIWKVSIDEPCPVVMAGGIRSSTAFLASEVAEVPLPPEKLMISEPEDSPCQSHLR